MKVRWTWGLLPLMINVVQAATPCESGDVDCLKLQIAQDPADVESRLALGQVWLGRALFGDAHAFDAALEQFEAIVQLDPRHALARASRGLIWVHRAADTATPTEQLDLARRGFEEIDAGVALAPDDPEVRLVRAVNAYQMPLSLGRHAIAEQDFAWLLTRVDANPPLSPALARKTLFHAGSRALKERRAEAVGLLERTLETPGPRPTAGEVQSMLALAREQFTPPNNGE